MEVRDSVPCFSWVQELGQVRNALALLPAVLALRTERVVRVCVEQLATKLVNDAGLTMKLLRSPQEPRVTLSDLSELFADGRDAKSLVDWLQNFL